MKKALEFLIKFYRNYLSIQMLHTCRFYPTCSQYALDCLKHNGFFKSIFYITRRLIMCSPLSHGGYDPAPAAISDGGEPNS